MGYSPYSVILYLFMNDEIVTVNQGAAPFKTEDDFNLFAFLTDDAAGVIARIGNKSFTDFAVIRIADDDGIAAFEMPFDTDDSGRKQAFAGFKCLRRALVDEDGTDRCNGAPNPEFTGIDGGRGRS